MTKFGWCAGPEGAVGDHDTCPYEIGCGPTILRCGCPCHEESA
jgi:hypothetical protein